MLSNKRKVRFQILSRVSGGLCVEDCEQKLVPFNSASPVEKVREKVDLSLKLAKPITEFKDSEIKKIASYKSSRTDLIINYKE